MDRSDIERLFDDWKAEAQEHDILETARAYGARLKKAGLKEWVGPCPACGGKDRFSVNVSKRIFNCRGAKGGDVIGMVMHIAGVDFKGACEALTGKPPPSGQSREISEEERAERAARRAASEKKAAEEAAELERHQAKRAASALGVWEAAKPIAGTMAEKYLVGRGIPVPPMGWPDVLGFHPSLDYELDFSIGRLPALVCRVQDFLGDTTAVWQIYLDPQTGGKARIENAKVGRGPAAGGAVRIGGIGRHIGAGEGVETALAVWTLINYRYPVWSTMDAGKMERFEPPLDVEKVTIYPDGDLHYRDSQGNIRPPQGLHSAGVLNTRMIEAGLASSITRPPHDGDFLDVLQTLIQQEAL